MGSLRAIGRPCTIRWWLEYALFRNATATGEILHSIAVSLFDVAQQLFFGEIEVYQPWDAGFAGPSGA
jgi:hypothetical protein